MIKEPMLAVILEDLSMLKYPVLCTSKLDGIRCLIVNEKAVTRKFKPIPNNYIRTYLEDISSEGFDGEIVIKGKQFNEINSAVMSEDGTPDFTYVVFDYERIYGQTYKERMFDLSCCPEMPRIEYLLPVQINNELELLAYEAKCLLDGYEGVMIRSPNSPYKYGRSTVKEGYLLKLKRFYDGEAVILVLQEKVHNQNEAIKNELGHTERSSHQANQIPANTLGAFIVREIKTGVEFKVGTGFDADFARQVWRNPELYLGQILKYKAQKVGEKDKPRFPSFVGFRDERDM